MLPKNMAITAFIFGVLLLVGGIVAAEQKSYTVMAILISLWSACIHYCIGLGNFYGDMTKELDPLLKQVADMRVKYAEIHSWATEEGEYYETQMNAIAALCRRLTDLEQSPEAGYNCEFLRSELIAALSECLDTLKQNREEMDKRGAARPKLEK